MSKRRLSDDFEYVRKVAREQKESDAASQAHLVAQHYNARPEVGVEKRQQSSIIRLRSFNNWVKSVLISRHVRQDATVLDMGCGKGGDLQKWARGRIGYLVGTDIAEVSLSQMKERYQTMRNARFKAEFIPLDSYSELLAPRLAPNIRFDLVSMQFCMHYSFESEKKARTMLQNVTANLAEGGWFIGTIPDANWIIKKVRTMPKGQHEIGNHVYSIKFEDIKDTDDGNKVGFTPFGCKYWFHLTDAVDCPEYIVPFPTFQSLAEEYGLELKFKQNFHQFFESASHEGDHNTLLRRMKVVGGYDPEMSKEEWEAAGIYLAFAFQKKKR
ncbi:guanine-N(7)-methyltransferase domain-containing protein [Umbelopsis sp. AD052]|nr:guanine-N(7)-methyltransferase domain-containing protein [Umbelopsis sp. AD052]